MRLAMAFAGLVVLFGVMACAPEAPTTVEAPSTASPEVTRATGMSTPTAVAATRTPEPTWTPVPTSTPVPTEVRCDSGLVSVAPLVAETIDRGFEINHAMAEQVTSRADFVRLQQESIDEISSMWRELGQGRGELVQGLVNGISAAWNQGKYTPIDDREQQKRNALDIAEAFDELGDALAQCDELSSAAGRLHQESRDLKQLVAELD